MALADFFGKSALAASQVLNNFDADRFEERLEAECIGIAFDATAANSTEGQLLLDLIIRLVARLWPRIAIVDEKDNYGSELADLASAINTNIDFSSCDEVTRALVVGNPEVDLDGDLLYVGSDKWLAYFSPDSPVPVGTSAVPFGAGAAACLGVANLFRLVFQHEVGSPIDPETCLSLFTYERDDDATGPEIQNVDLAETTVVGLGAIGNGVAWALKWLTGLEGTLHLVDDENVELSNLQRYVLMERRHVGASKVHTIAELLGDCGLKIEPHPVDWGDFIAGREGWAVPRATVCVDSPEARVDIQASLPAKIFNAYTQTGDLGVSRHLDFLESPCLACLYMPLDQTESKSAAVARAIGLPQAEPVVRQLLYSNQGMPRHLLENIAEANAIELEKLLQFENQSIDVFHREVVCGGALIELVNQPAEVEVPMAFQSAMAGIMLAAEVVVESLECERTALPTVTRFNALRPLPDELHDPFQKQNSGSCICQDQEYRAVWAKKYGD